MEMAKRKPRMVKVKTVINYQQYNPILAFNFNRNKKISLIFISGVGHLEVYC